MEEKSKYYVMWQVVKKKTKNGLVNQMFGKKVAYKTSIVHSYDNEEVANFGFKNIKSNGGYRPVLLKVLRE